MHPVTSYALDVIENRVITGTPERQACFRHLHDLARAGQMNSSLRARVRKGTKKAVPKKDGSFPWEFDETQASFVAIDWFRELQHIKGRLVGQPIELIPAHVFDIGSIFGWVSRAKKITRSNGRRVGIRRYRKALITEGRKNAKTTRIAGVALYMMVADMEENPEVYTAAVDKLQARVCFNSARDMAKKSKSIRKRLKIGLFDMRHKDRGGEMRAFSGDIQNKDAFSPTCSVIDEYWAHKTSEIYDALDLAQGQRLQPLMLIITTAGNDTESSCYKEIEYCREIVSGRVPNDGYFVMIRELDKNDKEHKPANWIKANPLLCATPEGIAEFQEMHDAAFDSKIPEKVRQFRIKKLNLWIHGAKGDSYMGEFMEQWDACAIPRADFDELTHGMDALVGADLSKKIDLTASAFIFSMDEERVALTAHGFLPEEAIAAHEKSDKIPYQTYVDDGWITTNPGDVIDDRVMRDFIIDSELDGQIRIFELCYDPYSATRFAIDFEERGYTRVEVRQTMPSLSEATKYLRELVISGNFVHDGNPLLRAHVANAIQITDSKENIMITKKFAGDTKRVDLLAASITALIRVAALREATSSRSLEGLGF
jgi:phage terminase large subunit-like protein